MLKPTERDRRITQALARLSDGETLAQVAATWSISKSTLCRVLIAYAPGEWRRALAARAIVRYLEATDEYLADPKNLIARGKAWATRWHFEYSLSKLPSAPAVSVRGPAFIGPCSNCHRQSASWRGGEAVRCCECEWEANARRYLLGDTQAPTTSTEAR